MHTHCCLLNALSRPDETYTQKIIDLRVVGGVSEDEENV
jgi:hypothetical protein